MRFIRNLLLSRLCSRSLAPGRYSELKIGLVADELTEAGLAAECKVVSLTPRNYQAVLRDWKPDMVFVESAWRGFKDSWKYVLASYPDHPERDNRLLRRLIGYAGDMGVPAVFWNKEDSVHYERFLDTARLFEFIFTVDANCVEKYRADVKHYRHVAPLMFPVQPRFHCLESANMKMNGFSCFVGSYSQHIHERRRRWQNMLFETLAPYGLDVYDRNYKRKANHYRYPSISGLKIRKGVAYQATADVYRSYKVSLNVNTIEDSPTMYSRRLLEIIAVGSVAISTPSLAVSNLFSEFCYVAGSQDELSGCIDNIRGIGYVRAKQRAEAGAILVSRQHTWENRLAQLEQAGVF